MLRAFLQRLEGALHRVLGLLGGLVFAFALSEVVLYLFAVFRYHILWFIGGSAAAFLCCSGLGLVLPRFFARFFVPVFNALANDPGHAMRGFRGMGVKCRKRPFVSLVMIDPLSASRRLTLRLTDAGPMMPDCQLRRDPGLACSRFVRRSSVQLDHRGALLQGLPRPSRSAYPPHGKSANSQMLGSCSTIPINTTIIASAAETCCTPV